MIVDQCQRWERRRQSHRPAGELFDPSRYGVRLLEGDDEARNFVEAHHYSGSYPSALLRVGLEEITKSGVPELVGVAVFSTPSSEKVIPKWTGQGPRQGAELGRFVLREHVKANAESWFGARALDLLHRTRPEIAAVVSFSDPVARKAEDGRLVMRGHIGTIYMALNARFVGRTEARWTPLAPDGRDIPKPLTDKVRYQKKGRDYAYAQLLEWGAPERRIGEDPADYVDRILAAGCFRRYRHPGKLAYVWPLGSRTAARAAAALLPEPLPYPEKAVSLAALRA